MEIDAECYSTSSLTFLQLFPRCKWVSKWVTEIDTECNETSSYTLIQDFFVLKACQK